MINIGPMLGVNINDIWGSRSGAKTYEGLRNGTGFCMHAGWSELEEPNLYKHQDVID